MELELVGKGLEIDGCNSSPSIQRQGLLYDIGARMCFGRSGGIFPVDLLLEQVTELGGLKYYCFRFITYLNLPH